MSTTQVETLTLPSEAIPLEAVASRTSNGESQVRRVFEQAPSTTLSVRSRYAITTLIVCANVVQFMSNFVTTAGGLALSSALGRGQGVGQANWMASSYSLTQGAFVLITGRLGAIYGHQRVMLIGCAIFTFFSLMTALCKTYNAFIAMRALTGIGGGLFMPNAVAIFTLTVPPGRSRNLLLGIFAASPPIGGTIGAVLAGIFIEIVEWKWMFVTIAGLSGAILVWLLLLLPEEEAVDKDGKIDFVGALLGLGSLLLFNVVWNQAPSVGWQTPYEIACLLLSLSLFFSFLLWESKFAKDPIMPLNVFRAPTFSALIVVVLLTYMAFGIALWYLLLWQQSLRHSSVMQTAVYFLPFGLGSVMAVILAAWLIPRLAAQWIVALGVVVIMAASLILATMPEQQTYWAQTFPALVLSSLCPDFVYVAAQIIASNSVPRRQQGVASSLIGTLNLYGNSLGLGFAGTIETELSKGGSDADGVGNIVRGYRAALYFAAGLAFVSLMVDFAFVRMPKDQREGWDASMEEDDADAIEIGAVLGASTTAVERPVPAAA